MNREYLSMAEATNICTYDQEYLSLLARRGLLQAEKIGRKWYTTREWLNEYLKEKRPNEIIAEDEKKRKEAKKIFGVSKNFKLSLIVTSMVAIIGVVSYWYTVHRIDQLEQMANNNKFILNEIVRIPDDQGNINTYGSGMVRINNDNPLEP